MAMEIQFSEQDWERIQKEWTAWWHQDIDRAMVVFDLTEENRIPFIPQVSGWDEETGQFPIDPILDYYQSWLCRDRYYGDSFPRWWLNFGAGTAAAFLGAAVDVDENTIWFHPPVEMDWEILSRPQDPDNFWWRWVTSLTEAAASRWGKAVNLSKTDLGGNLDILASLRGAQVLLLDLAIAPDQVLEWVKKITSRWWEYFQHLDRITSRSAPGCTCWAPMWCPGQYYMLQSDLSYMISPQMFVQYVMPDLETLCRKLEYSFYHLDGKGQLNHLEFLLNMPALDGVQWVPGAGAPSAEEWLDVLYRIRAAGKLCQVYVDAAGAVKIARELGPKGFTLMVSPPPPEEEIPGFLAELRAFAPGKFHG